MSGAERCGGGVSRPVRAGVGRGCGCVCGRRGRQRGAAVAERDQCAHPRVVGAAADRQRRRRGGRDRSGRRGRRAVVRQRR
nr:hypothetical protein [Mycobacterium tuberculosis]